MTELMATSTQASSLRSRTVLRVALSVAVALAAGASGYGLGKRSGYAEGFDSAYQQGGESGFEKGFAEAQLSSSAVAGASAAHVSKLLREERYQEAIAFLEGSVDDSLILYSGLTTLDPSPFGNADLRAQTRRIMKRVAVHRTIYPVVSEYPVARETIAGVLASLQPTTK